MWHCMWWVYLKLAKLIFFLSYLLHSQWNHLMLSFKLHVSLKVGSMNAILTSSSIKKKFWSKLKVHDCPCTFSVNTESTCIFPAFSSAPRCDTPEAAYTHKRYHSHIIERPEEHKKQITARAEQTNPIVSLVFGLLEQVIFKMANTGS